MEMLTAKVFIKGGILAPVDLRKIAHLAAGLGATHFQFGRRQELIIQIPDAAVEQFKLNFKAYETEIDYGQGFTKHNIVSSYLANNILPSTYWVKDGVFLDILDDIDETPSIRVNITDLKQDIVYSFTGDINFVASEEVNLWHVYLRTVSEDNLTFLPYLIYSEDIKKVITTFENLYRNDASLEEIEQTLAILLKTKLVESPLSPRIRVAEFFNYEGIHKYHEKYWLGIYKRNAEFNLSQLDSLCRLCEQNSIGQIHITPWKSLIIKDIIEETLMDWKALLVKHNINNGHSQSELNWQINDFDERAFALKTYIRKEFAQGDFCTNGVIIGINNRYKHSFSHIIIQEKLSRFFLGIPMKVTYDILHRKEFNPTLNEFLPFVQDIKIHDLTPSLKELVEEYHQKVYIDHTTFDAKPRISRKALKKALIKEREYAYQCPHCLTTYDPIFGDETQEIPAKTNFEELQSTYLCSLCDAPKEEFIKVNKGELGVR
ncbi:rubredoxin domain-containing protein [Xanthovirga aplysinae]|uniref:rubredoxin domain-containing protein n=1 Tax=Xanthovirga aplysinae TaxID=2529853 RepID=UPI0012BCDA58|nr:rubredoxin domain-containing protein [Xanthovirga aplysinae]MTI32443.1 rubredoxin domain-containing protein [Xanthovirga aplysinae]